MAKLVLREVRDVPLWIDPMASPQAGNQLEPAAIPQRCPAASRAGWKVSFCIQVLPTLEKQGNHQTKQGFKINSTRIIRMLNSRSSHYRATQRFPIKELLTLAGFFQSSRMKICCSGVQIGGSGGSDGSLPLLLHAGIHPGRGCVVFPVKMVQIKCKE